MGMEVYQVFLLGSTPPATITSYLEHHVHVTKVEGEHFVFCDGGHIIEIEQRTQGHVGGLVCQFAICHPVSIDLVFWTLVVELVEALHMTAELLDDFSPGCPTKFQPNEIREMMQYMMRGIAHERSLWKAMVGDEIAAVSSKEAIRRFMVGTRPPRRN